MTVYFLIKINNIITALNNITLIKVDVKPYEFDKMFMDKDLIEDRLYQVIYEFDKRKITPINI